MLNVLFALVVHSDLHTHHLCSHPHPSLSSVVYFFDFLLKSILDFVHISVKPTRYFGSQWEVDSGVDLVTGNGKGGAAEREAETRTTRICVCANSLRSAE